MPKVECFCVHITVLVDIMYTTEHQVNFEVMKKS